MTDQLPADIAEAINKITEFASAYGFARASDKPPFARGYSKARNALDAVISKYLGEWRPISEAPKGRDAEGKVQYVLLIAPYPGTDHWSDVRQCWYCDFTNTWERWPHRFAPTHWMPSPKPPATDLGRSALAEEGGGR